MIRDIDWNINPEDLQALTDAEIAELTERTTPAARARMQDAARELFIAKLIVNDTNPWRVLVAAYRATEPVRAEVDVVDDGGVPRVQVIVTERGFGIEGAAGRLHECVRELVRALDLIDMERERNRVNGARGGPKEKRNVGEEIAGFLRRRDYENSLNKKALRIEAAERYGVGKTTVTNAIAAHGLARRR